MSATWQWNLPEHNASSQSLLAQISLFTTSYTSLTILY